MKKVTKQPKVKDEPVRQFMEMWDHAYKERYQLSYAFSGGVEGSWLKRTFKWLDKNYGADKSFSVAVDSAHRYLKSDDPFIVKTGHKIVNFCTNIAVWTKNVKPGEKPPARPHPPPASEIIKKRESRPYVRLSDGDIVSRIKEDPIRFAKGLILFDAKASKIPVLRRAWKIVVKLLGAEKMHEIAKVVERDQKEKNLRFGS